MKISAVKSANSIPTSQTKQISKTKEHPQETKQVKVDAFVKAEQNQPVTYQPPKKLSAEQVNALKQNVQQSMMELAEKMLGKQHEFAKTADGKIDFAALADSMGIGRTPEAAAQAISEDGMWGVDAVATRLMDMAISLSNGDPAMAETLRDAVKKGFEAVGKLDSLPKVCQDTYHETMKRFDYWKENGSLEGYGTSEES